MKGRRMQTLGLNNEHVREGHIREENLSGSSGVISSEFVEGTRVDHRHFHKVLVR